MYYSTLDLSSLKRQTFKILHVIHLNKKTKKIKMASANSSFQIVFRNMQGNNTHSATHYKNVFLVVKYCLIP